MTKISRKSLINLTSFRQRNGILQKELADFLGVSRGYISLVESQKSKLAEENIEKIFKNPYHWNTDNLVPAYTRLNQVLDYLNKSDLSKFALNKDTITAIRHGNKDIPEHTVILLCQEAPELNKDWLLHGNGEMFIKKENKEPSPIEMLQNRIEELSKDIQKISETLQELLHFIKK